ncbi:hypothetical protein JTE90_015621 [Oedothorax gibbosus]|uniref:C2HC/C3H-type domain-containing protein n=1 Tax=Oedothorax gibbosus TaxID=931172 RepID=A0AAV6UW84_9ARAC|nr:hypothetical protein JTE90_015621 [Oedothorax gibbosus]
MEYPDPEVPVPTDLTPCPICGRTFRPDALTRHHRVCEKNAAKKRKVFDSSKQRALEDAAAHPKPEPAPKKPPAKAKVQRKQAAAAESKPKTNWREKHEDLINTIKQARGEEVKQPPTANGEPVKKKVPSDYSLRSWGPSLNQRAAERHIPWCQKKKSETPQSKSAPVDAKEKLIARVRYRPPQGRSSRPAHRKTKTVDAVASVDVQRRPPAASVPARGVAVVRSSPPNLVDKRNSRNASLDRNNNNNSGGNSNNINNANVTNANWGRRSGSRSREKPELTLSSPDLTAHIIKFKEKFPNSKKKR